MLKAPASWLSIVPSVPTPNASEDASNWRMDVMGHPVDPLSVAFNGSRHFHAVHRGVCYDDTKTRLAIETIDAPLVAPGDSAHLLDFDNELPDLAGGWHFSLHNNAGWDASAPFWLGEREQEGHQQRHQSESCNHGIKSCNPVILDS